VVRTYVDWFLALPFSKRSEDRLDLTQAKKRLDADHFGLKSVKDRILEQIAVFRLARHPSTPILCLVGPPGVGKTSLGKSIADSLGRTFVRISLGGVRDEAEIRGHRRTYIGSMPGRIVQALKRAGTMNPVLLLDEIDKMSGDFRGDPASALLEALDPEQNRDFADHFLEVGIDLSDILFITTANVEERIPAALHDRLEVIRISGYFEEEKIEIARKHLLPRVQVSCGLEAEDFSPDTDCLRHLIRRYTHEAGVRQLSRQLSSLARKRARDKVAAGAVGPSVSGESNALARKRKNAAIKLAKLTPQSLAKELGPPVRPERLLPATYPPGMVTGLAWTPLGGETLRVECSLLSGRGKLVLTGQLGDVMKESAQLALTLARERARRYGLEPAELQKTDIHLHVPEGAVPKDGPSAGIALVLALLSAMTRRSLSPKLAFTGEISLMGQTHAVGGINEKAVAALQAGVTDLYLPSENTSDAGALPKEAKQGLRIHRVAHIDEILEKVLPAPKLERMEKTTIKASPKPTPKAKTKALAGRKKG
jgi:ATP-dependent Lon protease